MGRRRTKRHIIRVGVLGVGRTGNINMVRPRNEVRGGAIVPIRR